MLVLSRKVGEQVTIGGTIGVTVLAIHGHTVRLGYTAPEEVPIYRNELSPLDRDIAELFLLLPGGQAAALEAAARARGLTVGQLLRRLVGDFLGQQTHPLHSEGA